MVEVNKGQTLELYFVDGTPDGMLTATLSNWSGHVLMTPRTQLAEALKRVEASYTGVYILLGQSEDPDKDSRPMACIGESEDVAARIRDHDAKRLWWDTGILITDGKRLNKAHVKYLESRLVELAKSIGQLKLVNGNAPTRSRLTEADESKMLQFLAYLVAILPAIRVNGFLSKARSITANAVQTSPLKRVETVTVFKMKTPRNDISGVAELRNGEFIVQPGSVGRKAWEGDAEHSYRQLFHDVVMSGATVDNGKNRIFSEAYAFSSPSAAGAVLNGRATNGPAVWYLASDPKKSYRQWEAERLDEATLPNKRRKPKVRS
ncbi:GIY-YIG nuclease family protein [Granulicella sp. dw_53]|uniref:GIY-YIG nuclease family protein n=1 Tax=Granulicella sp. dw_53 TaxID=2719792 RepID=UPI001BD347F5|nr:GIY-YIG nuclease family protein [Granulicella sp. dw_53]